MDWEPVVDGDFLPTDPVTEDSFAEAGKDIPLLIGSNLNEWSGFFESGPYEATEALTAALQSAYPDKPDLTAEQVDSTTIRLPLLKIMSHKADQVSQAWISFARSGVPGADGLPEWEPYTREGGATMILDTESRLANHHDQALMSLLAPDYKY